MLTAVALMSACGDKVPESEAARSAGAAPKQTLDKIGDDTAKALQQGVERDRSADEGAR
jgi:hypothetical protein